MKKKEAWFTVKGPRYSGAAPKRVDMALLKSVDWPGEKDILRLEFNAPVALAKFPSINIPSKYLVRLACYSAGKGVKYALKGSPNSGVEAREPKSKAELIKLGKLAHAAFYKTWRGRVSKSFLPVTKRYAREFLPKTDSLLLFKSGRLAGMFSLLKHPMHDGTYDLVTWHSAMPGLSAAARRSVLQQGAAWLSKTAKRQLVVGLDGFDKDSLKFFSGLGFKVHRMSFERLKP
jgi:hypothetical protein